EHAALDAVAGAVRMHARGGVVAAGVGPNHTARANRIDPIPFVTGAKTGFDDRVATVAVNAHPGRVGGGGAGVSVGDGHTVSQHGLADDEAGGNALGGGVLAG